MNPYFEKIFRIILFCILTQVFGTGSPMHAAAQSVSVFSAPLQGPALQIEESTYAFGKVTGKSEIEHAFLMRNIGTEDLEIIKVTVG